MELIRKSDALHAVLHNQGDAAVAAVQMIPSAWIKCSERLPEKSGYYIVYERYSGVMYMRWSNVYRAWNCSDESDKYRLDYVTHWMPLPDAPERD